MRKALLPTLIFCLISIVCAGITQGTFFTPPPTYPRVAVASPSYGFEAYLWWRPEIATRDLGLVRDAGFTWVKQTFAWRYIEVNKGQYDWSRADDTVFLAGHFGLKLLIRLDRDPWWDRSYPDGKGIASGPPRDL